MKINSLGTPCCIETKMKHNLKINLLGHVSQTGQYPMRVVPIGRKVLVSGFQGKLVGVFHDSYAEIPEDYDYVKHVGQVHAFEPYKKGLFAISKDEVLVYELEKSKDFYRDILGREEVKAASPFIRITFVREAELWDDIPKILVECLRSVENVEAFDGWVASEIQDAEEVVGHKLDISELQQLQASRK